MLPYHLMNQSQIPQSSIQSLPFSGPAVPTSPYLPVCPYRDKTIRALTPHLHLQEWGKDGLLSITL